jgi:hypothetical protein
MHINLPAGKYNLQAFKVFDDKPSKLELVSSIQCGLHPTAFVRPKSILAFVC